MADPAPPKAHEPPSLRQAARYFARLVRLIRPYWHQLAQGMVLAVILGLLGMVAPYLTKLLIDEVYPRGAVSLMHVLVGGLLAFSLTSALLGAFGHYFNLHVNTRLGSATRLLFFNHLQHLDTRFFDRHQVGEIHSRFQDVGRALASIGKVFQTVFAQGIYLLLVPPVLFLLEWRLALIALITLPLIVGVIAGSGRVLRGAWQRSSEARADLDAFQVETLSHIRTFKTMGLERHVYRRAENFTVHAMDQQLRAGGLSQLVNAATGGLHALNTALFTWFGWTLILGGRMSLGDYIAFTAYMGYLYGPLLQLVQLVSDAQQSAVHLARMFEYLDAPPEQDPRHAYAPEPPIEHRLDGGFRLDGVDFGYAPDQPILRGIDLDLPAGSITAVVGPSGAGKTTLLRLLARLERPTAGQVTVDGRPLDALPLGELRRQLAVVWQDVALLEGTLWDNLVLGAEPSLDEALRAVRLCGLGPVVDALPAGLDTPVSEWGSNLSAGQRQRVALARAVLRDAPILLLDEATANVDVETERTILRGVFDALRGTTVVFVTHRLANATLADRVCVLTDGAIQGVGRHAELLERCAPYRRMVEAGDAPGERSTRSTPTPILR